jgi:hypothetical protein
MLGDGGAMSFWPLFLIVFVVFSAFFYIAQFKLDGRYRGVKIASWAYPLSIAGTLIFAIGLHGLGVAMFLLGVLFVLVGTYIHFCKMFGLNVKFRRPARWDEDQ